MTGGLSVVQFFCRVAAWLLGLCIFLLHVVPANYRLTTPAGHSLEHIAVFLLIGLTCGFGYHRQFRSLLLGLAAYCLFLEAIQMVVPGRHPRISDLLMNTTSALLGACLTRLLAGPER